MQGRSSGSLLEAYLSTAYTGEWDIMGFRELIDGTDEQTVIDTSMKLLTGAEDHLQTQVSRIKGLGHDYEAQLLSPRG